MEEFPHRKAATSLLATIMADIENKASVAESGSPERAVEPAGVNDEGAIPKGTIDPVYEAKARVLNRAIQDIGMGKYQWQLFIVVGFGWANDNLWPIVTSLICGFPFPDQSHTY